MKRGEHLQSEEAAGPASGLTLWILERLRRSPHATPRLALLERITLAPRQSLALVEADGRRLLVATSPEGAPTFYALDGQPVTAVTTRPVSTKRAGRISW